MCRATPQTPTSKVIQAAIESNGALLYSSNIAEWDRLYLRKVCLHLWTVDVVMSTNITFVKSLILKGWVCIDSSVDS